MASRDVCHVGRPLGKTTRKGRLGRPNLWLLACAGACYLLLYPSACALRHRGGTSLRADQDGASQATEVTDAVCSASEAKVYTATLSESNQKVSLRCGAAEDTVVPAGLKEGLVCPSGVSSLTTCKTATDSGSPTKDKPVSLSVLMGGTEGSPVSWVERTPTERAPGKKYELSLPNAPLPLLDSAFVTGCIPATSRDPQKECKLTVTVKARKSAAAGQTVYCAYGAESNMAKPTVTVTQQNNTMTLVCGTEAISAVPLPADYKTKYCADDNLDAGCKEETFSSFIPGFQSTWWTQDKGAHNVTLSIPPEHFPDSPKTIHFGCRYTPPAEGTKAQDAEAANKNLCQVDVVISAKESSASDRAVAALPGLTVGAVLLSISLFMWF